MVFDKVIISVCSKTKHDDGNVKIVGAPVNPFAAWPTNQ